MKKFGLSGQKGLDVSRLPVIPRHCRVKINIPVAVESQYSSFLSWIVILDNLRYADKCAVKSQVCFSNSDLGDRKFRGLFFGWIPQMGPETKIIHAECVFKVVLLNL